MFAFVKLQKFIFRIKTCIFVKNYYSANFRLSCWSYDEERKKKKIRHTRRHKLQLNQIKIDFQQIFAHIFLNIFQEKNLKTHYIHKAYVTPFVIYIPGFITVSTLSFNNSYTLKNRYRNGSHILVVITLWVLFCTQ